MADPIYPADSKWTVLKSTYRGKPMYVRRNESARALLGHKDYRHRIGVAVAVYRPAEDGLPDSEDFEALAGVEDSLCTLLEKDQLSLLVLAITTGGMREFVFYARDAAAASHVKELRVLFPDRKITSYVAEDSEWELYSQFS